MKNLLFLLNLVAFTANAVLGQLPTGSGSFQVVSPTNNKTIDVATYVPTGAGPTSSIIMVMHGAGGNGVQARDGWIALANQYKFIILGPYFDTQWSGTYQTAGLDGFSGDWEIDVLDYVFDEAKRRQGSTVSKFYFYGMSAGCQFVHRVSTFTSSTKIKAVVCAAAGFYTFPTDMEMFPFGLFAAGPDPKLDKHFCRNTHIIVGGADTTRDSGLLQGGAADAQGLNRLERAQNYFNFSKTTAADMKLTFNWKFYVAPGVAHTNGPLATYAAAEFARWDATGINETCAPLQSTTPRPTTTTTLPSTAAPNPCNGPLDLVFVIDGSDTMTAARFASVKTQLATAINQNGISMGPNGAHVGIVISTGIEPGWNTTPYRYLDLEGCQYSDGCSTPGVSSTAQLLNAINNMKFMGGKNDIGLSMMETLTGEYIGLPQSYYIFGGPYWKSAGDRPNVTNVMIIISGADTSEVAPARDALIAEGVKVYAVGLSGLAPAQLQAITGNPSNAYANGESALASAITSICYSIDDKPATTTIATTTAKVEEPTTPQCPWEVTSDGGETIIHSTPTQRYVTTVYTTSPTVFPTSTYATFEPTTPEEEPTMCSGYSPIPRAKRSVPQIETTQCYGGALSAEDRLAILTTHNQYRSQLAQGDIRLPDQSYLSPARNQYKLKWSCDLEATAQKWANNCQFEHSAADSRNAGENIYMSLTPTASDASFQARAEAISKALDLWWSEISRFGGVSRANVTFTMDAFSKGIGHWSQMAWGASTEIGCGIAQCPQAEAGKLMTLFVCNYQSQGNGIGREIYQIGAPCVRDTDCTRYPDSGCDTGLKLCFV